jgi:hypothetical protein
MTPILRFISKEFFQQSKSKIVAWPLFGFSKPKRMLMVVVFPAPFLPMKPAMPLGTCRLSSFSAVLFPKDLMRVVVFIIGLLKLLACFSFAGNLLV